MVARQSAGVLEWKTMVTKGPCLYESFSFGLSMNEEPKIVHSGFSVILSLFLLSLLRSIMLYSQLIKMNIGLSIISV